MRVTGKVKWFDVSRGFGLIRRNRGETDCFVHHSAMRGTVYNALAAGDPVEFDVIQDGAGAVARDVIRLGRSLVPATLEGE
ncbi:MAG TPA: cold shock domain-containing protein [Gemmatimonadales bacterium]|nr:cold shock domain-containing protein [Gemmatimonadales bacterium]